MNLHLYCKRRTENHLNPKYSLFSLLEILRFTLLQYLVVNRKIKYLQYNPNTVIVLKCKLNKDVETFFLGNNVFFKFIYKYSVNLKRFLCKYQKMPYQILHHLRRLQLTQLTLFVLFNFFCIRFFR